MPEAVIVSVARSPIGRAFKGSLTSVRPDDLAADIVQAALDKVPGLNPHDIDDLMLGVGQPAGAHGNNLARIVSILLGTGPPAGHDGQPVLLVVAPDDADGVSRDQGPAREMPSSRLESKRSASTASACRTTPRAATRASRRRARGPPLPLPTGRTDGRIRAGKGSCPTPISRWVRRPRTWRC